MSKEELLMQKAFKIRVTHSLGFFSFYEIKADNYHDAESIAEKTFIEQFCGGKNETTFRGVKEKHTVESYTFNKYEWEK